MTIRVELLIIGNEILSGQIIDTNGQWLAQQLLNLNLPVQQRTTIPDEVPTIATAFQDSMNRGTTLLITSGGLGPTLDDRTAEGLAHAIGVKLELHPVAFQMVEKRYQLLFERGLVTTSTISDARQKMAWLPHGSQPILNSVGSAPGIRIQYQQAQIFCLPGVPQELQAMFTNEIQPHIRSRTEQYIQNKTIRIPLIDESTLAPILEEISREESSVYLKSMPRPYQSQQPLQVTITVQARTRSVAQKTLSRVIQKLRAAVQEIEKTNP